MTVEILTIIASSSLLAIIVKEVFEIIKHQRDRKEQKEDGEKLDIVQRLERIEKQNTANSEASKYLLYDKIRHLAEKHIAEGEITFDDRSMLHKMHNVYHFELDGNGDLDTLMAEVDKLPLKKVA